MSLHDQTLSFFFRFEEVEDVGLLSCSAILDDGVHQGNDDDDLLVDVLDVMVPCPVLLVGVCLLEPIKSRRLANSYHLEQEKTISFPSQQSYTNER